RARPPQRRAGDRRLAARGAPGALPPARSPHERGGPRPAAGDGARAAGRGLDVRLPRPRPAPLRGAGPRQQGLPPRRRRPAARRLLLQRRDRAGRRRDVPARLHVVDRAAPRGRARMSGRGAKAAALVRAWLWIDFFGGTRRSGEPGSTLTSPSFTQSFVGLVVAALTFGSRVGAVA